MAGKTSDKRQGPEKSCFVVLKMQYLCYKRQKVLLQNGLVFGNMRVIKGFTGKSLYKLKQTPGQIALFGGREWGIEQER